MSRVADRTFARLEHAAERAIEYLAELGADHADVGVATGDELTVSVRCGQVDLLKEARSSGMSVRVIRDGRVATSSTTDLSDDALRAFAARAVEMAALSEEDPLAAPPDRSELARRIPALELFDPASERIRADRAIAMATRAEKVAFATDRRITASEGASYSRSSGYSVFATSAGFCGRSSGTYQSLAMQAIADDRDGKKRNGVHWTGGRFFSELESPAEVGRQAARRAINSLGARKLPTGNYPIVFDKEAGRQILGLLAGCVLGDSVYRERSYLGRRLGEPIASELVTIVDDPSLPRAPGSRAFDGEGRSVRRNVVVEKGVLKTFLLDTHSARRLKLRPTGSAAGGGGIPHSSTSNFFLRPGRSSPRSLLRGIDRGFYVVRTMGFGFDPVTGNFSRGAEGFLIDHGDIGHPVAEVTISRNLDEILKGIDRIADDLDHKTAVDSPTFRVDEMTVAGE